MNNGVMHAFVPKRLEIPGYPSLSVFPFNILFMAFRGAEDHFVEGHSLYLPDPETYDKAGDVEVMTYRNRYGGNCHVHIAYDAAQKMYTGQKFVCGRLVGSAFGSTWNGFFIHLTGMGLSNGERCSMNRIEHESSREAVGQSQPVSLTHEQPHFDKALQGGSDE